MARCFAIRFSRGEKTSERMRNGSNEKEWRRERGEERRGEERRGKESSGGEERKEGKEEGRRRRERERERGERTIERRLETERERKRRTCKTEQRCHHSFCPFLANGRCLDLARERKTLTDLSYLLYLLKKKKK